MNLLQKFLGSRIYFISACCDPGVSFISEIKAKGSLALGVHLCTKGGVVTLGNRAIFLRMK